MKAVFFLVALFIVGIAATTSFDEFKANQGKKYATKEEEDAAKKAYEDSQKAAEAHNADPSQTYKKTASSDPDADNTRKTEKNFVGKAAKNFIKSGAASGAAEKISAKHVRGDPPAALNLVPQMTAVKDQKTCGCGYAMSATAILEYFSLKTKANGGKGFVLSDQNVIDCDKNNAGCTGGHPGNTLVYAKTAGIADGTKYTFTGKNGTSCNPKKYPSVQKIAKPCYGELDGDEKTLMSILATYGPFSVFLDSQGTGFSAYKSGVYSDKKCSDDIEDADYVSTMVGYGTDTKLGNFWLLRNSKGAAWGEKGYWRIQRGKTGQNLNMCGVANLVFGVCG